MSKINVFVQGEGIKNVLRLEFEPESTVLDMKRSCTAQANVRVDGEAVVFLENHDEPLAEVVSLESVASKGGVHVHIHRCHRIEVKVTYSGRTVNRGFGPGKTIGAVKHWAADGFGIPKEDAAELVLQIAGTHEQPDVDTHIGSLTTFPICGISLDLIPNPRIQGAL
jgi:hypothetical protein